jgi:hypothetical protein
MRLFGVVAVVALASAACGASTPARVVTYAPKSGPRPSIPVALSGGTVWYNDANLTVIIPFDTSSHTFAKPIPDPTAIPNGVSPRLRGAPLSVQSFARGADGNLWGVGIAERRWGKSDVASTTAIVKLDPKGSTHAYPVPEGYTAGNVTFEGPNHRPWSMLWTRHATLRVPLKVDGAATAQFTMPRGRAPGVYAEVVQINADGTIETKFRVPRSRLPRVYTAARYARYGTNGIVWLLDSTFPHTAITRWMLDSQNPTTIQLTEQYSGAALLTTAPDGSAWVMAQQFENQRYAGTYVYRVSVAGSVTRHAIATTSFPAPLMPAAIFSASGSTWCVAVIGYGSNVGTAYLVKIDSSGVERSPIAGASGSIAEENASIASRDGTAFLASFSGALPELRYRP